MITGYGELILKNGGRKEFWVTQVALVSRFIEAHGKELTKVHDVQVRTAAVEAPAAPQLAQRTLLWDPTRGGMRTPHLHHGGDIYLLNEAHWAEFSKGAVAAMTERLTKAGRVGFETVMQLSDAVAGL